jgi:hypothetical protein
MNSETVFWDGTYCMVCQHNYGEPDNTEVENFLCRRCNDYAKRNALTLRIDLFEEQSAKYRHPANSIASDNPIKYETLDISFSEADMNEDVVNHVPCSACNREDVEGMWLLQADRGTYMEVISGPLCDSCYQAASEDYYGESEV